MQRVSEAHWEAVVVSGARNLRCNSMTCRLADSLPTVADLVPRKFPLQFAFYSLK